MKINLKFDSIISLLFLFIIMKISFAKEIKVFDGKTSIENPFKLRDPFHSPIFKKSKNSDIAGKISSTVYNDAPSINNVKLDDITITGVVIGKERRAFAKAKGVNRVVILKEGMKIGENKAELRAILPGGLILVEKTVNIYGEEEYLETILPISK